MGENYSVNFDEYCERHYIKSFEKKYHQAWVKTRITIEDVCRRIDNMLLYNRADLIAAVDEYKLVKLDFAVQGTRVSPKASGNRCILVVDEMRHNVDILLVYNKDIIGPPNETTKWRAEVKQAFPDIGKLFNL
jgi:hypothetical protein